jgi:hypothetical protein
MSARVTAILAHRVATLDEFDALPGRLRAVSESAWRVADEYWGRQSDRRDFDVWRIAPLGGSLATAAPPERFENAVGPVIRGPGDETGLHSLTFGRRCVYVHTLAKWRAAIAEPALLRACREFVAEVAHVVESDAILIYHDESGLAVDRVLDGLTLGQIQDEMLANGLEPVPSLEELAAAADPSKPVGHFYWQVLAGPGGLQVRPRSEKPST